MPDEIYLMLTEENNLLGEMREMIVIYSIEN